ncbi:ejaculatory bulb-specific protein 3 isoform X2 [Nilaparvata lugens]|uniref:Chemosensory protein 11 n=1 Tax=Nilaparvata lugens TaxID=108931 RepID=A0A067XN15_NILLU|nr:ejaculatory bulb-specific protein 3 isoform X2 [Nilaparvata lugens]AGO81736.1 chemosensory protein 11 [Nilaparvata lugens]ASL05052.1 chemosensory protein 11 [Nilaparvata lugens]
MKSIILLVFVSMSAMVYRCRADEPSYPTSWDNVNIDEVLGNERLVQNYAKCLLEKGSCSPEGTELKKAIPDALKTGCTKCSDKQKAGAQKVIKWLVQKKPELWKEVVDKYDPSGEYTKKYEKEYQI